MARINLCPNPSLKNNAADFFGGGFRVAGVTNMVRTSAYQNSNAETTGPRGAVTAGLTYRFSAFVKGNGGASTGTANINWYSNNQYLSSAPGVSFTVLDGQVSRVDSGARVAPAGADQALLNITGLDTGTQATGYLYSPSAALTDFFDGDDDDAEWTGADGNSVSATSVGDDGQETPPPDNPGGDPGSSDIAGVVQGWGTPIYFDDFDYTGAPNSQWGLYNGPGHNNNGLRRPSAWSVQDSILRCFGNAGGTSGGASNETPGGDRQYGRWEVRLRVYNTGGGSNEQYHPVLIIWPSSEDWPADGEYDFLEGDVGDTDAGAFIHYPHPDPNNIQQEFRSFAGVRLSDWHNYAIDWQPDGITGYIDGRFWYRVSGGAGPAGRRNIQTMPQGSLRIQLDNFGGSPHREAAMDIDWVRIWTHTSVSTNSGITPTGIPSRAAVGAHLLGNRFRMYLDNASATTTTGLASAWDQTAGAVTGRLLGLGRSGANAAVTVAETSTSNQFDALLGQWISEPMTSGGTLQGAYSYVVARNESSTAADLVSHIVLKVVSGDGTVLRGVAADLVNPTEWGTTLQAISINSTITNPITCLAGDRLVAEVGYRATNVTATSNSGTIRYGGTGDLEANDTGSNATTLSPWINFADRRVEALFRGQQVTPSGIARTPTFGAATVTHPPTLAVTTTGIATHAALGSPVVTSLARILEPTGIPPGVMGSPTVNQSVVAVGIASVAVVGTHRVRRATDLYPDGIVSGGVVGTPTLVHFQEVFPVGIATRETFGLTEVEDPHRRIFPSGIPSGAAVGVPVQVRHILRTVSIPSAEAFGGKRLEVKRGSWKLVNPERIERYRVGGPMNVIYITNIVPSTVWGDDNNLDAAENPRTEDLDSAKYVWLGGHDNITDSIAIRNLWVANGFQVEMTF